MLSCSETVRTLLLELSSSNISNMEDEARAEELLSSFSDRFQKLYGTGYRHRYSEILDILKEIDVDSENSDDSPEEVDSEDASEKEDYDEAPEWEEDHLVILSDNLSYLREYVRKNIDKYGEGTFKGLTKLSDHVDIEIHRYREIQNLEYHLSDTDYDMDSMSNRLKEMSSKLQKANELVERTAGAANRLQVEMVTILGIFATIVIAFSGGLSIIGDAISSPGDVSIFERVYVVLLCAIVVFNIIAFLMLTIMRITDKSRNWGRTLPMKLRKRIRRGVLNNGYVISFNIVLIAMLVVDAVMWHLFG